MAEKTKYKQIDEAGESTLETISKADNFNQWMYNTIKPYCKGKILEIGSGIGNISEFFIKDNYDITLSDIRERYCLKLDENFNEYKNFLGAHVIDLTDPNFDEKFTTHLESYDTVFALNVVEHIYNDDLALKNCRKLLSEGGHLVILVPSYQKLFNQFDTELGHYRRYTQTTLSELFSASDFKIIHKQYFNFVGIFGWYLSGNILGKKEIPGGQMKVYNSLVPVFKIIDNVILNSMGLSTIVVGKK